MYINQFHIHLRIELNLKLQMKKNQADSNWDHCSVPNVMMGMGFVSRQEHDHCYIHST